MELSPLSCLLCQHYARCFCIPIIYAKYYAGIICPSLAINHQFLSFWSKQQIICVGPDDQNEKEKKLNAFLRLLIRNSCGKYNCYMSPRSPYYCTYNTTNHAGINTICVEVSYQSLQGSLYCGNQQCDDHCQSLHAGSLLLWQVAV